SPNPAASSTRPSSSSPAATSCSAASPATVPGACKQYSSSAADTSSPATTGARYRSGGRDEPVHVASQLRSAQALQCPCALRVRDTADNRYVAPVVSRGAPAR